MRGERASVNVMSVVTRVNRAIRSGMDSRNAPSEKGSRREKRNSCRYTRRLLFRGDLRFDGDNATDAR